MKRKTFTENTVRKGAKESLSKLRDGKIKKLGKERSSISNTFSTSNGVQSLVNGMKTDSDANHVDKVMGKKMKLLKKKFGAALNIKGVPTNPQNKKEVHSKFSNNGEFKGKRKRGKEMRERKREKKRKTEDATKAEENKNVPPLTRHSDDSIPKKVKWINRQRVLLFGCRGITTRDRHLMNDLRRLLPHSKPENKMERKENLRVVNEMCEMKNCNKCMLFEGRGSRDVYMWLSNIPRGPSIKFELQNIYTMEELRFTGNCLAGTRPILSFDENFENYLHYRFIKEFLVQIFGIPNHHPKSQPFFDHVFTFSVLDKRIWFRNYQILSEDGAVVEIGPRFIMNPIKVFSGSFGGETLWENTHYVTPAKYRKQLKMSLSGKYLARISKKLERENTSGFEVSYNLPETDEVFTDNTWQKAQELISSKTEVGGKVRKKKRKQQTQSQKQKKKNLKKRKIQKRKTQKGETQK